MSKDRPRHRPSPALIVGGVALFIALGGTGYSTVTTLLPQNSVRSPQVINGSLRTTDLSRRTIASVKRKGAPGARGAQGAGGPRGATGAQGAAGAQGQTGVQGGVGAGAGAITFDQAKVVNDPGRRLAFGELTLVPRCNNQGANQAFGLDAEASVAASLHSGYTTYRSFDNTYEVHQDHIDLSPLTPHFTGLIGATNIGYVAWEGVLIYHSSSRVITVTFHAVNNADTGRCQLTGTVVSA